MLFQIYGENAGYQLLGWVLAFLGLLLTNEIARRSKAGGVFFFAVLPIVLGIYFIAIEIAANQGAEWALSNQTYLYMNGWFHYAKLYDAAAGSRVIIVTTAYSNDRIRLSSPLLNNQINNWCAV